jgi:hypothetical protein
MQRRGHNLTIAQTEGQLVATCECGRWRRMLPVSRLVPLRSAVAQLAGRHERHLIRIATPAMEASEDELPTLPDGE